MKKYLTWLFLLSIFTGGVLAQNATDKTVGDIRAYYNEITEKARSAEAKTEGGEPNEAARYGGLVMNELAVNKLGREWRAVGIYALTYKFFYTGGDSETHLYPDELVKVVAQKRISARTYVQEFLYDKKGALVFYFQKAENDEEAPAERRVYFSLGKAIRVIEDANKRDRLTAADAATIKKITQDSIRIKDIFNRSIKL